MFDLSQIMQLLKVDPGNGLVQSLLLFMIWLSSRGLKKELVALRDSLTDMKIHHEVRFEQIEARVQTLERKNA